MPEQQLDGAHVSAGFEQVDGKGVTQGVGRDRLGDGGLARTFLQTSSTAEAVIGQGCSTLNS